MTEIKVNLSIVLQGSVMFSKDECLKTIQKEVERKNKRTGKTYKKTINIKVEDPDKMDSHSMKVTEYVNKKPVSEVISFTTRKTKPAIQSINICKESYDEMTSSECPYWSKPKIWNNMSKKDRLEAHLQRIAEGVGGVSYTYKVLE